MSFLEKIFGGNRQVVSKIQGIVEEINKLEPKFEAFSDDQITEQIVKWKDELKDKTYEDQQLILNKFLPGVFALTKEAEKGSFGQRHYDFQFVGGFVLHRGQIVERRTGEGKP